METLSMNKNGSFYFETGPTLPMFIPNSVGSYFTYPEDPPQRDKLQDNSVYKTISMDFTFP